MVKVENVRKGMTVRDAVDMEGRVTYIYSDLDGRCCVQIRTKNETLVYRAIHRLTNVSKVSLFAKIFRKRATKSQIKAHHAWLRNSIKAYQVNEDTINVETHTPEQRRTLLNQSPTLTQLSIRQLLYILWWDRMHSNKSKRFYVSLSHGDDAYVAYVKARTEGNG